MREDGKRAGLQRGRFSPAVSGPGADRQRGDHGVDTEDLQKAETKIKMGKKKRYNLNVEYCKKCGYSRWKTVDKFLRIFQCRVCKSIRHDAAPKEEGQK